MFYRTSTLMLFLALIAWASQPIRTAAAEDNLPIIAPLNGVVLDPSILDVYENSRRKYKNNDFCATASKSKSKLDECASAKTQFPDLSTENIGINIEEYFVDTVRDEAILGIAEKTEDYTDGLHSQSRLKGILKNTSRLFGIVYASKEVQFLIISMFWKEAPAQIKSGNIGTKRTPVRMIEGLEELRARDELCSPIDIACANDLRSPRP